MIESCPPPGSGRKHSHTIKSHHNVGGLPKDLKFQLVEPLRELFKVCLAVLICQPAQTEPLHSCLICGNAGFGGVRCRQSWVCWRRSDAVCAAVGCTAAACVQMDVSYDKQSKSKHLLEAKGCFAVRLGSMQPMSLWVQDEVRALGRLPALNVPEAFIARHPFPGLPAL